MNKSFAYAALARILAFAIGVLTALPAAADDAQAGVDATAAIARALQSQVQRFAESGVDQADASAGRIEISVGSLDPRLRLAPCSNVEPYLPPGTKLWGRARIGLRCLQGPSRWNVFLPITIHVYARVLVAAAALPAGSVLQQADLREAEVDIAEDSGGTYTEPQRLAGRSLARPIAAGQALRSTQLKLRQWFAAGDAVRITAQGSGYAVAGVGEALTPGLEGQTVRVRTESGRVVTGTAVAVREVELAL